MAVEGGSSIEGGFKPSEQYEVDRMYTLPSLQPKCKYSLKSFCPRISWVPKNFLNGLTTFYER